MTIDHRRLVTDVLADRRLLGWLAALIVVNVGLVGLHTAYFVCLRFGLDAWPRDPIFSLDSNTGFAQAFNSAQTLLLIGLLLQLAMRTRTALYLAFGVVFLIVLIDDALAVNQVLGQVLVGAFGLIDRPRLEAQSLAEMLVYGSIAVPVLGLLAAALSRAGEHHRPAAAGFLLLLGLLGFFATVMDLVHLAFIKSFFGSRLVLEVLEEGGEMLTVSLALLFALTLVRRLTDAAGPRPVALPAP